MNPDPYLETPHLRNPSGGTLSSVEYDPAEEYSISSMENDTATGYKNNLSGTCAHDSRSFDQRTQKPVFHPRLGQHQPYTNGAQALSTFATPQSSPQSARSNQHSNGHGTGSYQSSSGSEDDRDHGSHEPALLGQMSRTTYRARRDSGLPPIKMSAAKRLPPFNASLSSIPAEAVLEEEEEEEEEEQGHHVNGHEPLLDHEDDVEGVSLNDDEEVVQVLDRDMDVRQARNLPKGKENGGSKQRYVPMAFCVVLCKIQQHPDGTAMQDGTTMQQGIHRHNRGSQQKICPRHWCP